MKIKGLMNNKKNRTVFFAACLILFSFVSLSEGALGPAFTGKESGHDVPLHYYQTEIETVIGSPGRHVVEKGETFLDIARNYRLGFNEMELLYPDIDPWIPPPGMEIVIPSQWILPGTVERGIIINSAELRLYYFTRAGADSVVRTFPIGIGDLDFPTPEGNFKVGEKRKNPAWYVPPSLREKHGVSVIPPGPGNPLGDYWIRLGWSSYGIHGTENPWSVGRLMTHGCIRLYPEDIEFLFREVPLGTPVRILYEPVKIGFAHGRVFAEVHKDVYELIDDFQEYGLRRLQEKNVEDRVDVEKFLKLLERKNGLPTDISLPDPLR